MHGRQRGVHVIPHGSYVGAYPNTCTRAEARERLGLGKDRFVYLFLGLLRRYKGVDDLIVAFEQLDETSSELMIAGRIHDPIYASKLAAHTRDKDAIHTWFEYVQDHELQYFMQACDVCVLPYRDVTTSGAGVLAFSFGRPIVAPALGGFPELCANGRGFVYDAAEPEGLRRALRQARHSDVMEAGKRALAWAKEHRWSALAPRFVAMYRDALGAGK
jgi:glycosyltransferase involved in cell wall biosynthesis